MESTPRSPNNLSGRLGADHECLTCFYQSRRFRLTDAHGKVVENLIA